MPLEREEWREKWIVDVTGGNGGKWPRSWSEFRDLSDKRVFQRVLLLLMYFLICRSVCGRYVVALLWFYHLLIAHAHQTALQKRLASPFVPDSRHYRTLTEYVCHRPALFTSNIFKCKTAVYDVGVYLRYDVTLTEFNHKCTLFLQYLFPFHFFHAEFVS